MACNTRSIRFHGSLIFSLELVADKQQKGRAASQPLLSIRHWVAKPTKLREEAINSDDGDRAVRMI